MWINDLMDMICVLKVHLMIIQFIDKSNYEFETNWKMFSLPNALCFLYVD